MASESDDGAGFTAIRLIINLSAFTVSVATVALIVATIIVELD